MSILDEQIKIRCDQLADSAKTLCDAYPNEPWELKDIHNNLLYRCGNNLKRSYIPERPTIGYYLTGIAGCARYLKTGDVNGAPLAFDQMSQIFVDNRVADYLIGDSFEAEYAADFTVAKIFSDDMVVQRNEHIRVWGFAPESENGKKVSGEFKGMFAEALIENGEWCLTFRKRLEADVNGAEMRIYTLNKEIKFSRVLVGDVYLVMGQSNAAYSVASHLANSDPATQGGGEAAITESSLIRLNWLNGSGGTYAKKATDYVYPDLENTKAWTKTTLADTKPFSAIGYYYGQEMVKRSNNTVPVGLIEAAIGGAPIGSFLPNELAEKHKTDYYKSSTQCYVTTRSTSHNGRYMYNCYLAPISRFAVAGAIWYQGESDNPESYSRAYVEIFDDFIEHLRKSHNVLRKNFPVFIVELPTQYQQPENFSGQWNYMDVGKIRTYMGSIPSIVRNCYLSASSDLWSNKEFADTIHPACKFEQANRLAALAETIIIGASELNTAGSPIFKNYKLNADKTIATIKFNNVGDGLTTINGSKNVTGLIGLVDDPYSPNLVNPSSATITDTNEITVIFPEPVRAVAYNYNTTDFYGDTLNLCNSAKMPCIAFITPFEEEDLGVFEEEDIIDGVNGSIKYNRVSFDNLLRNGDNVFATASNVLGHLIQNNYKIDLPQGISHLSLAGWVGFDYKIKLLGHSIDDAAAIFDTYASDPEPAVINAGGQYAKRFNISIDLRGLELGEHTVNYLALVDADGGSAVKLLSFTVNLICNHEYDSANIRSNGDGTHAIICKHCGQEYIENCTPSYRIYNAANHMWEDRCTCGYVTDASYLLHCFEGTDVINHMVDVNKGTPSCFLTVVNPVEATQNDPAYTHLTFKPGSYDATDAYDYDGDGDIDNIDKLYTGTNSAHKTPYFYIYKTDGSSETGRYLIVKYRIPAASVSSSSNMFSAYASTVNAGMTGSDAISNPKYGFANGEWGVFVMDLAASPTFTPAADGKYYAKYVVFVVAGAVYNGTMDIAYVGLSDNLDGIAGYIDENVEGRNSHTCLYSNAEQLESDIVVDGITYAKNEYHRSKCVICEQVNYVRHNCITNQMDDGLKYVCNCGHQGTQEIDTSAACKFISAVDLYAIPGWANSFDKNLIVEDDNVYFRLTGKGATLYANIFSGNTAETGHLLVMKYRVSDPSSSRNMNIWSYTDGSGANGSKGKISPPATTSGEWQTIVVDLSTNAYFVPDSVDGKYYAKFLRLDPWAYSTSNNGKSIDIAYFAMFNSEDAIDRFLNTSNN